RAQVPASHRAVERRPQGQAAPTVDRRRGAALTEAGPAEAELPAAVRRVQAALAAVGLDAQVVITGTTARTAEDAAVAVGVEVGQIVKSLVFLAGDRPV